MAGVVDRTLDVRSNSITPCLRVRMRVHDSAVDVSWTETVLGLIPFRRRTATCLDRAEARLGPRFFPNRALASLFSLVAFGLSTSGWVKLGAAVVAAILAILSVVMVVHLPGPNGSTARVPVCWLHRRRIAAFLQEGS